MATALVEKENITIRDVESELMDIWSIIQALVLNLDDLEGVAGNNFITMKKSLKDNDYSRVIDKLDAQISLMKYSVVAAKQKIDYITDLF